MKKQIVIQVVGPLPDFIEAGSTQQEPHTTGVAQQAMRFADAKHAEAFLEQANIDRSAVYKIAEVYATE